MRACVYTLGCKVNTYESEYIMLMLIEEGYEVVNNLDDVSDVYIINTCTVTNTADIKSRKIINRIKRNNPNACIVALGCYVEDHPSDDLGIDIYIGNKDKSKIVELLDLYFTNKEPIRRVGLNKEKFEDMYITDFKNRCRAFVKVQDGCENFCSYCIIPYVRGKCRSKDLNTVVSEVTALVNKGFKEIVLTGIHTGHYGVDLDTSFADLLNALVKINGLKRLRISSIEITELTDEVLDIIKNNKVIVDHLHIPLQAGSDKILKLMNRKYDLEYFENKLKEIRKIRPNISITTDIIVGFPNESEEDFKETIENSKKFAFTKIHVFPYSDRLGTVASTMAGHIDGNIKKDRARRLLLVSHELERKYANKFIGKSLEVLFEEEKNGVSIGHTSNYLKVKVKACIPSNTFKKVKIKSYLLDSLIGEVDE